MPPGPRRAGPATPFFWPLGRRGRIIGRPYQGTHTLGNWQSDKAIDIGVPVGTAVYAVQDGRIDKVKLGANDGSRFAGSQITLAGETDNFFYTHLSRIAPGITAGQQVKRGQLIGYSGSANGVPHLHFATERGGPMHFLGATIPGSSEAGRVETVEDIVDTITGAPLDAAEAAAQAAARATWRLLVDVIGENGARALMYVLLVGGGVTLAVIGAARAAGVRPSSVTQLAPPLRAARAAKGAA